MSTRKIYKLACLLRDARRRSSSEPPDGRFSEVSELCNEIANECIEIIEVFLGRAGEGGSNTHMDTTMHGYMCTST